MNTTCSSTTNLQNSTILSQYISLEPYQLVLYKFVMPCIILVGLTGNVMFIWTVIRVSSLHTSTFIYLFSLAWSDLFTLVSFVIYLTNGFLNTFRLGKFSSTYIVSETIWWFSFITSKWFVTLVSLERYLAICHPIKYRQFKGTKRAIKGSLLSVVLTLVISSTLVVQDVGKTSTWCLVWPTDDRFENYPRVITVYSGILDHRYQNFQIYLDILYVFIELFTLSINCYMYLRILTTLLRRKYNTALQVSNELDRNIQQISTMVIANGIVFFLCSTVFNAVMVVSPIALLGLKVLTIQQLNALEHVQLVLILVNASVNPLIYFIANPSYRRALKASVMKCRRE